MSFRTCGGSRLIYCDGRTALTAGRHLSRRRLCRASGRRTTSGWTVGDPAGAMAVIGYRYFFCHPGDHHCTISELSAATSRATFGGRPRRRGTVSPLGSCAPTRIFGAALVGRSCCSAASVATTASSRSRRATSRSARSAASSSCAAVSASSICSRSALIRCVTSSLARRSWPSFVSRSRMVLRASVSNRSVSSRAAVCCRRACRAASNCRKREPLSL
jgi:hypothetical protein